MGAAVSIIHNRNNPKQDRIFKVLNVQKYYLPEWYDVNWRKVYPNVAPLVGNEPQHEEIYWSSEDEDETIEDTCRNKD